MAGRSRPLHIVILAAGLGKRMKSARTKLLHEVAGRPMIDYVRDAVLRLRAERRIIIIGNQAEAVRERIPPSRFETVLQREQLGTGHAVLQTEKLLSRARGDVLILNGDLPGIAPATLRRFTDGHRSQGAAASVLTAILPDPAGYGRVVRDEEGKFLRIVEHADATAAQRRIREINAGVYCFSRDALFRMLRRLRPQNRQGEIYLPDVLELLAAEGLGVRAVQHADAWEVLGVNSRSELAEASRRINQRRVEALMEGGVTVFDPGSTRIGPEVRVGRDTILHGSVHLGGRTSVGRNSLICPGCFIMDCRIGDGVTLLPYSVLMESVVGDGSRVGPFAHLRPGTVLAAAVHVGNFVEVKKSRLGTGTKANHLSYLGDAEIGSGVNVGAGTITCNYDGVAKHLTVIEDGAFIGSDTQLVAPVTVGKGAYVGTGATIREHVPPGALAVSAGKQRNIDGWVEQKKRELKG